MSNALRAVRRRVLAVLTMPLLLATGTAAAPTPSVADQITYNQISYKETFYSDYSYSTIVGWGYRMCDGELVMYSGYETEFVKYRWIATCP